MCAAIAPPEGGIGAAVLAARAEALPCVGQCWLGVFDVESVVDATAGGERVWRARRRDTAEVVELRQLPEGADPLRDEAWTRLRGIELPQLARAMECVAVSDSRVEVSDAGRGESLREWRAKRAKVDMASIETFVAQMAEALGALHAHGLVHLGLRPEAIFVQEEAEGIRFVVGGLGSVAVSDRAGRLARKVDPFYAPPEAVGLKEHPAGGTLCVWDWWTLGRVTQELFLGRHIFGQMIGCDVSQPTAAAIAQAEGFLQEPDGQKGMRAGAVELMAPLDARIDLLLRGLLTSAAEGRWSAEFVDRWLRKMPVKETYTSPRADAWFRWQGQPLTAAEAAAVLRTPAESAGAVEHIWEAGKRGTLARFLARSEPQKKAYDRLTELLALASMPALKPWPVALVREALAAVALLQLGGAPFLWRGERLGNDSSDERIALLRLLATRSILLEIERCDPDTARWLAELAKTAGEAESWVRRAGAIATSDGDVTAAMFRFALEAAATVEAPVTELRRAFPTSTQPITHRLVTNERAGRAELIALAWIARDPKRYGLLTAAEAQQLDVARLQARGAAIAISWFWLRLEAALASGPLFFGGLRLVAAAWVVVAVATGAIFPGIAGILIGVGLIGAVLAVRAAGAATISGAVKKVAPNVRAWGWRDDAGRCRIEHGACPESGDARSFAAAHAALNVELTKLTLVEPRPSALVAPPTFGGVRLLGLASWVLLLAIVAGLGWRVKVQPPSREQHRQAWGLREPGTRDPNEPVKVAWPYKPGDAPAVLTVVRSFEASKDQLKQMLALGRTRVEPYRPETITTLVLLPVHGSEPNAAMIFDGKRGALVNQRVYVLPYQPLARSWVEVAEQKAIYLPD